MSSSMNHVAGMVRAENVDINVAKPATAIDHAAVTEVQTVTVTIEEWVYEFLAEKFFTKCRVHYLQKNELNRYCIACRSPVCKKCLATGFHEDHRVLTVYRHVYQDVVPLAQMEGHFDCSRIQAYRCNQKRVVSLTPLPHTGSGSFLKGNEVCNVCRRKLTDPEKYSFCSMACKVESITGRSAAWRPTGEGNSGTGVGIGFRKRSRKGIPRRAALQ